MSDGKSTLIQRNPRPKLEGRTLSNWTVGDAVLLIIIVTTTGLVLWQVTPMLALLPASLLVLLYRSPKGYGRLYQDFITEFRSGWRNDVHKGVWWRAHDTEGSKFTRWQRRRHNVLPAQFVRISTEIDGELTRFCLLHQTDRPYDHLFISAQGGAFAEADVNQQTRLVGEMNSLLDQIIAQSDLKAGISHIRITGPFDQMIVAQNMSGGLDPIIKHPDMFKLDEATKDWVEWARANARQIPVALEQHHASAVWSFIVITIKRRHKWSNLQFTNQQIAEIPIIELGQALIEGLRESGNLMLQDVHSPSLPESALIARCSWDTVDIGDYYRKRAKGEIPTTDEEVDAIIESYMEAAEVKAATVRSKRKRQAILNQAATEGAQAVDKLLQAWPQECIETDGKENYLRFDDNYIAILRVTELPEEFRSDQIMSLHWIVKNRWTRFAFVSESTSGDSQSDMLIMQASLLENYNRTRYARRVVRDPRRAKRSRDVLEQLDQMSVNTIAQMANGLITVIERDPQKLRRAVKEVKARYGSLGLKTEQVKGSARLIDYYFTGALAANRA